MQNHRTMKKNVLETVKLHIKENSKYYIIIGIFFIIGIILGVVFFNNLDGNLQNQINDYLFDFINSIKDGKQVNSIELLKQIIINNAISTLILWFIGCTAIGLPIAYGIISLKGFSLSYTICCITSVLGLSKGIAFCILGLLLQHILEIPAYIAIGVSSSKLCAKIIRDKKRENIKIEMIRHTLFCALAFIFLVIASVVETYISTPLVQIYINSV